MKPTIYIIGRMRGFEFFNLRAFDNAQAQLEHRGWSVVNPHAQDRLAGFDVLKYGLRPDIDWSAYPPPGMFDRQACLERCEQAVRRSDAIFVLPGGLGEGGLREFKLAVELGKGIHFQQDGYPTPPEKPSEVAQKTPSGPEPTQEPVLLEAHRLVNGNRQSDYGHPLDDFSKTAAMWSAILAAPVSPQQVGLCMCAVKISRQLNKPKRDNMVDLAGYAATVQMVADEAERRAGK